MLVNNNNYISGNVSDSVRYAFEAPGSDFSSKNDFILRFKKRFNSNLILANQVHGSDCVHVGLEHVNHKFDADCLITNEYSLAVGVWFADCVPVLVADNLRGTIAAIHVGWKGAFRSIIEKLAAQIKLSNSNLSDVSVVIGPCIRKSSYEVDIDFRDKFATKDKSSIKCFQYIKEKKKYLFDLPLYVKLKLSMLGFVNINDCGIDTYNNNLGFLSYRKKNTINSMRNLAWIMIENHDWNGIMNDVRVLPKKNYYSSGLDLGVSNSVFKNVNKVESYEVDLHGLSLDDAHKVLREFLVRHCALGTKSPLNIITGNGLVLKPEVHKLLSRGDLSMYVKKYKKAPISRGGEGAIFVWLNV